MNFQYISHIFNLFKQKDLNPDFSFFILVVLRFDVDLKYLSSSSRNYRRDIYHYGKFILNDGNNNIFIQFLQQ